MYHLDAVHQRRQRVDYGGRSSTVQGLDEALESVKELDVVLSLVCGLGDVDVDLRQAGVGGSEREG